MLHLVDPKSLNFQVSQKSMSEPPKQPPRVSLRPLSGASAGRLASLRGPVSPVTSVLARPQHLPATPRNADSHDMLISSSSGSSAANTPQPAVLSARELLAQARQVEVKSGKDDLGMKGRMPKGMTIGPKKVVGIKSSKSPMKNEPGSSASFGAMAFRESHNTDYGESSYRPQALPLSGVSHVSEGASKVLIGSDGLMRERELILFQLPRLLPTLQDNKTPPVVVEEESKKVKKSAYRQDKQVTQVGTALSELPDGCIGKLRIHASGRVVAVIGNIEFDVDEGHQGCFRQEIACLCPDEEEVVFLGQVTNKLILSPSILEDSTNIMEIDT